MDEQDDGVVGNDEHTGKHVEPHHDCDDEGPLAVRRRLEDLEAADCCLDSSVILQLLLQLVELLDGGLMVLFGPSIMEALKDCLCLFVATLLHKPARGVGQPCRAEKHDDGRGGLEC